MFIKFSIYGRAKNSLSLFFVERKILEHFVRDPRIIRGIEEEVEKRYGKETIKNPEDITESERREYTRQKKEMLKRERDRIVNTEKIDVRGFLISKEVKKVCEERTKKRTCPVCGVFSFCFKDDVYMTKFGCCEICYIKNIEGRT
jgi:hypothetical protein